MRTMYIILIFLKTIFLNCTNNILLNFIHGNRYIENIDRTAMDLQSSPPPPKYRATPLTGVVFVRTWPLKELKLYKSASKPEQQRLSRSIRL